MPADLGSLHRILKDPTRRRILSLLSEKASVGYVEMLGLLEIEHTGKLNYHLKLLGDLIAKDEAGRYVLTEKGKLATEVASKFQSSSGQEKFATLRVGRAGIGKLLFVISVPLFILSLIPLTRDYQEASGLSLFLGVVTALFLVFGVAFAVPANQTGNGFGSRGQLLTYAGLESLLVILVLAGIVLPSKYVIPSLAVEPNWIAGLVYLAIFPGLVAWLVLALRLKTHDLQAVLEVPFVASIFLWVGGLVLTGIIEFMFRANVGFFVVYGLVLTFVIPFTSFLFIGVLASEGAYRLVGWKTQTGPR